MGLAIWEEQIDGQTVNTGTSNSGSGPKNGGWSKTDRKTSLGSISQGKAREESTKKIIGIDPTFIGLLYAIGGTREYKGGGIHERG